MRLTAVGSSTRSVASGRSLQFPIQAKQITFAPAASTPARRNLVFSLAGFRSVPSIQKIAVDGGLLPPVVRSGAMHPVDSWWGCR
jgi:hypothetical protein